MIIPLLTLPFLSGKLGTEGFGYIAFGLSFAIIFETYLRFGFDLIAIRDGAKLIAEDRGVNVLFTRVLFSRIVLLIPGLLVVLLVALLFDLSQIQKNIITINIALACLNAFNNDWFFQAQKQMLYLAFFNLASKGLYVILIFCFISSSADILIEPLAVVAGACLTTITSNIIIARQYQIRLEHVSIREITDFIKSGYGLFTTLLLPNLYTTLSYIYLERAGPHTVGIFSGGYRIVSVFESVNQIANKVFYPELSQNPGYFKRFLQAGMFLSAFTSVLLFLFAPHIVHLLLGPDFENSTQIIRIMSLAPLALFTMVAFGQNFLVLNNAETAYSRIVVICSLLGGFSSYFLIAHFEATGAALAIILTWSSRACVSALVSYKIARND